MNHEAVSDPKGRKDTALLRFVQADAAFLVETIAASAEDGVAQVVRPSGRSLTSPTARHAATSQGSR